MPCDHKFQEDLDLIKIDFEPTTLIVGTFTPAWPANNVEWFYGRTANNLFWDVLPRLYGSPTLINAGPAEWKQFCHDKQIALTDLISSVDDAEPDNKEHNKIINSHSDPAIAYHFDDFSFVNIVQILKHHPGIRNVYLTRNVTEAFWRHVWNPVMQYCNLNHIHERKLLPPSGEDAVYQQEAYNKQHPDKTLSLQDYILMRWREEWQF